jgi:hypothetical protein
VRPGLRGHGLTVKAGTKIERFEVEVLDVMRNFLSKQDVILVKCLGDEFADHRIAQGMSGSPVYFDGKIAGALSYTWSWANAALGGVTPIEAMLAEGDRPLEGRPTGAEPPTPLRPRKPASTDDGTALVPIGAPMTVSGFSPQSREALAREFGPLGMTVGAGGAPSAPGGAATWADLHAPMEPGCALVVDLLRGDFGASVLGTCTFVDGDKVYGFGHDFTMSGETLFPMSVGYVYTVVSSRQISFKLGGAIRQVGALVQDRPSGVVGVLGKDAPMVPFDVHFENAVTKRAEDFHFEVTPNTLYFQRMLTYALSEAFARAEATLGKNTKRYRLAVKLKGLEPWTYEDVIAGFDSGFSRVMIGFVDRVLNNDRQRVEFESVKVDVEIERTDRRAGVEGAAASVDEARAGDIVPVVVALRRYEGGDVVRETIDVRVPRDAPLGDYVLTITGGDMVPADVAAPVDVTDIPALYAGFYKATELVAVLPTGRVDLDLEGRLVRGVPLSSIPRLVRSPGGDGATLRPVTEKVRKDVPYVIVGSQVVAIRVVR